MQEQFPVLILNMGPIRAEPGAGRITCLSSSFTDLDLLVWSQRSCSLQGQGAYFGNFFCASAVPHQCSDRESKVNGM